ncbi:hypothetical protein CEQ90_20345 [Lewinellaceae bacterium SD302]|nr:hypothetical protein CEQ90_20345 [Lewinellaceae bacterium SD302]
MGCENHDNVYLGLKVSEYVEWKDTAYEYSNNHLLFVKSDSLYIQRLINDGCIFTSELLTYKIHENDKNVKYVVTEKMDTILFDLKKIDSYSYEMEGPTFNHTYTPAEKCKTNPTELDEVYKIIGNSYKFKINDIDYLISFYDYTSILRSSDGNNEYINLANWGILEANGCLFLTIDFKGETLKFQIKRLDSGVITLYYFGDFESNIIKMTMIKNNLHKLSKNWKLEKDVDYSKHLNLESTTSSYEWLGLENDFLAFDLNGKSNIYDEGDSVYIDWNSQTIIIRSNYILSFEILNGKRLEVFKVLESGKIDKMHSKIYYNFDSPNIAPPSTRR